MSDKALRWMGLTAPWPYSADLPQRYSGNYSRYAARGGLVRPEADVRGFVAADPGNRGDMARFYFFCLVLDQIVKEGLRGDVAELGVYKGSTAVLLAGIARRIGATAYLLDTFEGFSERDFVGVDAGQGVQFQDTSLDAVRGLVGDDHVRYVKGHFPGTAAQLPDGGQYCVVHIDCDLYAPMLSALEYFYPRLVPGGFLIMHDYSSLHWNGAEQAVDEFFADKTECIVPLTDSAGSVVIRKARPASGFGGWLVRRKAEKLAHGWVNAGNNGLADFLGGGWSSPEPWGVWGIGDCHELRLYLPEVPRGDLALEATVQAVLIGPRVISLIDVCVGGAVLATWTFEPAHNHADRRVEIPAAIVANAMAGQRIPTLKVEFRPREVASPVELDPTAADGRTLGLGVAAIRLVPSTNLG